MPSSNRAAPAYIHPVPQEEYDPYRFSRDQNEQQQQQDDEDFYREIRLDAYENQVDDNVPLSGGGQEQPVYRAREEYEEEYFGANINNEPNEDRYSNAPSAYRPREEVYDGDEEKLQLAQDDSFDAEDWDEKEKELDFNSPFEEFAGGFGAPPEVRFLLSRDTVLDSELIYSPISEGDDSKDENGEESQVDGGKLGSRLCDSDEAVDFFAQSRRGGIPNN